MFFISCNNPFLLNVQDYHINDMPLDDAWKIVSSYKYIEDGLNDWKSPNEFIKNGGGDCKDFCTYMLYLLGPDASIIVVHFPFSKNMHAIVYYHGQYIEPQAYNEFYPEYIIKMYFIEEYSYYKIMFNVTGAGTRDIIWK